MRSLIKSVIFVFLFFFLGIKIYAANSINTPYNITKVRITDKNGTKSIIASSYEGVILNINYAGTTIWENKLSGYVNHDIWSDDITGDGKDEIFAANADGYLYCLNSDGTLRWKFRQNETPMYAVCVVRKNNVPYVVCGGYDHKLYYLNADGTINTTVDTDFTISNPWGSKVKPPNGRCIANFLRPIKDENGNEFLAVAGTINSMQVKGDIYIFNVLGSLIDAQKSTTLAPIGDLKVGDIDNDGNEELLIGPSSLINEACLVNYDTKDKTQSLFKIKDINNKIDDKFGYRMVQTSVVTDSGTRKYFIKYGNQIILLPADLNKDNAEVITGKYSYNDMWYDDLNNKMIFASAQSGGSNIHVLNLSSSTWKTGYQNLEPTGNLAKLITNSTTARNSLNAFQKPNWEREQKKVYWASRASSGTPKTLMESLENNYQNPVFVPNYFSKHVEDPVLSGHTTLGNIEYRNRRDSRKDYDWTQQQVLTEFAKYQNQGYGVSSWAGHGNDPYFYSLETIEKIIDQSGGEKTFLLFPELEAHTDDFAWMLDNHIYPIAEYAQGKNAHIYVRTKNIFWQSTAHMPLWDRMSSGEFADVFIPGMEETTDKMMDVSVPGRVGFWLSGAVNQWGCRAARDETSYDRLREYSHQRIPNHFLRQYIYNLSNGATFINNFDYNLEYMGFLWELVAKGVIYVPERDELLNISPVHLSMVDVDKHYLEEGANVKWTTFYDKSIEDGNKMVFSRMNGSWPGAPVTEWDYSSYASGAKDRRLNFLPPNENGMVLITPPQEGAALVPNLPRGKMSDNLHPIYKNIMQEYYTDGHSYYSADLQSKYPANTYYSTVADEIESAAQKLPITVSGNVAWVSAQSSPNHIRLTLIDGGFINPSDKIATVTFNTVVPVKIKDLLDGKTYTPSDVVSIDVPCGLFRFLDIELQEELAPADNVSGIDAPEVITPSDVLSINVNYRASESRNLVLSLRNTNNNSIYGSISKVVNGEGSTTFRFAPNNPPIGNYYKWEAHLNPIGSPQEDVVGGVFQKVVEVSNTASIFELENKTVKIYPLPFKDEIRVDLNGNTADKYDLYDLRGSLILTNNINETVNEVEIRNLDFLSPGVYTLKISGQSFVESYKVIKKK